MVDRHASYRIERRAARGRRTCRQRGESQPIPVVLLSTTVTRGPTSPAASWADSYVPDSRDDRCTETIPSAPASSNRRYADVNCEGAGRDVRTSARRADSARATSAGAISTPSSPSAPLTTTVSGTTVSSYLPLSSTGRYAVESVTTATDMRAR
jgi:hypothetical protein